MAIKAGQIITDAQGTVVSRIQDAGVSSMNFPKERVYELGNFHTVGIVRDLPDLSFNLNSYDVSCDAEALLTGVDPTTVVDGQSFTFDSSVPLDVISPFKPGQNLYTIVNGLIVPYLTLDTVSYKYGLKADAQQTFTLRGDSVYYTPGSPYFQTYAFTGAAGPYALAHTANLYIETGVDIYVNALCWQAPDGTYGRLFHGQHYTDTSSGFTLTAEALATVPNPAKLKACYGSLDVAEYPQARNDATAPPIRPAALRSWNLDVYIGSTDATPVFTRVEGVQAFTADRKVNLDKDEEFGNVHYVNQDYDTADVTGTVQIRAANSAALFALIRKLAGVADGQTSGVLSLVQLPVEMHLNSPVDGSRLKTLYIPDAVFNAPAISGKVQTKLDVTFDFESEEGILNVSKGRRAGT